MKKRCFFFRRCCVLILLAAITTGTGAFAATVQPWTRARNSAAPARLTRAHMGRDLLMLQQQLAAVRKQLKGYHRLKEKVRALAQAQENKWKDGQNAAFVRQIASAVLAESKKQAAAMESLQAGYDNGFFIRTTDKKTSLIVNGELQYRYLFAHAQPQINGAVGGDSNGFFFRRARISFSGTLLSPRLFYMIQGDFAGGASNQGNFQLNNVFIAYSLSPLLNVRFGSYAVPFSKLQWCENDTGLGFAEFPETFLPFDPDHSLGASLFGDILPDRLSYEVMVNDGSQANLTGYSADPLGARDNRLGFYGRMQFAGAGKESDFPNEPDLAFRRHFIWMIGAAAGFEEQNSTAGAFPAPQTTLMLAGLSAPGSAGFVAPLALNGTIYRATIDYSAKYRGWSVDAAAFFQDINDSLPAGATTDGLRSAFGRSSLWQLGWYVQSGYFLIPHRWELVARVGGLSNQGGMAGMHTYALGLNYYLFGYSARIQNSVTYIPTAAYTDPQTGTFINSRDIIMQTQFQINF